MNKIIPVFYSEYGRYINRFRAIPSYIDALKPVERRILLVLHQSARGPKPTKSAKVVGDAIGKYHPHGDQSTYGTLVNLVRQKYAVGKGNWGAPALRKKEERAAAYRYTEVMLEKWVENLVFDLIDFVPYEELESEPEPLFLTSPIPIGLIGEGTIIGISFYKTLIPKYKLSDLAKRLSWKLSKHPTADNGPEIKPNIMGCTIQETEPNQYYNILTKGIGSITVIPDGKLLEKEKTIKILGRAPNASFASLVKAAENLEISIIDHCTSVIEITIEALKRGVDLTLLGQKIWQDHLITNLNFNCLFCDNEGKVSTISIDDILITNYNIWTYCSLLKKIDQYNKFANRKFELTIIQIIRYILEQYKINRVPELLEKYRELSNNTKLDVEIEEYDLEKRAWTKVNKTIYEDNIVEVCSKRSIKNLIEMTIDMQKVNNDLIAAKINIDNNEKDCKEYIKLLESY